VDPAKTLIVLLTDAARCDDALLGGKAISLGRLIDAGYRVPEGFCISTDAYEHFVSANELEGVIGMEISRKPFASMRWEEIWDSALRIRSAFLAGVPPADVVEAIMRAHDNLAPKAMVVRSSAPGEDSAHRSYAGLHESLVGVVGEQALIDAVRVVWASLWSDAALLYRKELGMNPRHSRMAVVVQTLVTADRSGVGFGVDPREPDNDKEVIEAVPGLCEDLVSGAVDPDRWILKRSSGEIVEWRAGDRPASDGRPILGRADLGVLHKTLSSIESIMGWPADVEWTGRSSDLTLLQARPITKAAERQDDEKAWYLTLRPGMARLDALCTRVTEQLIPELEAQAVRFAQEEIQLYDAQKLADAIEERHEELDRWKRIYRDEFIPFAHGVRQLGLYYNDAVRPDDPYEFVGLLENQPMIASERNAALRSLATLVRESAGLTNSLEKMLESGRFETRKELEAHAPTFLNGEKGASFIRKLCAFLDQYMNFSYDAEQLDNRPDHIVRIVLELAAEPDHTARETVDASGRLEKRLVDAVGLDRENEALDILRIARLSWRLRDDDNILIGRLENQLRRALELAARRLRRDGRLQTDTRVDPTAASMIIDALRNPRGDAITLPPKMATSEDEPSSTGGTPRQMVGQPAAPGCTTGRVRVVRHVDDIGKFRNGEVIVCDAIQPTMTHLLPLASAVIERRGGMLIHGAIIAREMGIPCVNGIPDATKRLHDGEIVTVDGHLGIVTVGRPEFDLELGGRK
jgi:pyruvate,water dikinase